MIMGADLAPSGEPGPFLGVWSLICDLGSSTGPLLLGSLAEHFSLEVGCVTVACLGFFATAWFWLMTPESLNYEKRMQERVAALPALPVPANESGPGAVESRL